MATIINTVGLAGYKPMFLQAASGDDPVALGLTYSGDAMRNLIGAVFPTTGRVGPNSFNILPRAAGAGWFIDINAGFAVVGDSVNEFDRYLCFNPARFSIAISFPTNPAAQRTHRVFLTVYDKQVTGTEYAQKIVITEDTGTGAGVPADNQAYYLELGQFTLTSGNTAIFAANITNSAGHAGHAYGQQQIPLNTGYVNGTPGVTGGLGNARWAVAGSLCRLMGSVQPASGMFAAGGSYVIGTLPAEARPRVNRTCAAVGAGGYPIRAVINASSGTITVNWTDSTALAFVSLDGVAFELD